MKRESNYESHNIQCEYTTQSDYKVIFKGFYYFHGITHYHRHIITDTINVKQSVEYYSVIGKGIVYYWQMRPPITITITITGNI